METRTQYVAAVRGRRSAMVERYGKAAQEEQRCVEALKLAQWAGLTEVVGHYTARLALARMDLKNIEAEISSLNLAVSP